MSLKLIIIPSGDQDGTYTRYIKPNWPEVRAWQLSMMNFAYNVRDTLAAEDQVYVSAGWTRENISARGPLGALYRVWGDDKQMVKGDRTDYFGLSGYTTHQLRQMGYLVWTPAHEKGSFIGEGDTPTFLNLLDNGLRAYRNGNWGGWGGITLGANIPALGLGGDQITAVSADDPGFAIGLAPAGSSVNAPKATASVGGRPGASGGQPNLPKKPAENARFFAAAQNDFATRLTWSVTPKFSHANHEPKIRIKGPMEISARPGRTVPLEGEASDPDGNAVKVTWWQYKAAGTYRGEINLSDAAALSTTFRVPDEAQFGNTIHVLLEATDNGTPPLTRYQRVIIKIQ